MRTATIETRVGHIGDHDNHFLGRPVFERLADEIPGLGDAIALGLGVGPSDAVREVFRLLAISLMSPDARVWPLKLCRLLSSHGDPVVGFFASQLVSAGTIMGPGTTAECAAALRFVATETDGNPDPDCVGLAIDRWRAAHGGRLVGFGVPFRPEDERLLGLRKLVRGTPTASRPYWRLQERVVTAMASRVAAQPNVVLGVAALLLDVGVAPARCGIAVSLAMSHVFVAHALEAAVTDGGTLHDLPADAVTYVGVGPRSSGDPAAPGRETPTRRRRSPGPTGTNDYERAGGAR